MPELNSVLEEIAQNLDERRLEITSLRRVLFHYEGKVLENTVVRMAIPMLYADWEGYVKEVCQLYVEYIERLGVRAGELQPDILGYSWRSALRPLTRGLSFERQRTVAQFALASLQQPVRFERGERAIDTKSNLRFEVLEEVASCLCIDIGGLSNWRAHLDALVHLRNNIAHGSRPRAMDCALFEEHASHLVALMEAFEDAVSRALTTRTFQRTVISS